LAYLLDTNVAVHLRDGDRAFRSHLLSLHETPSISAVTRVELEGGVYAHPDLAERRRRAVDALLREFIILDFTDEMTRKTLPAFGPAQPAASNVVALARR